MRFVKKEDAKKKKMCKSCKMKEKMKNLRQNVHHHHHHHYAPHNSPTKKYETQEAFCDMKPNKEIENLSVFFTGTILIKQQASVPVYLIVVTKNKIFNMKY